MRNAVIRKKRLKSERVIVPRFKIVKNEITPERIRAISTRRESL